MGNMTDLLSRVDGLKNELVAFASDLIRIPAISPVSGGTGELRKAEFIEKKLVELGFDDIQHLDAPFPEAEGGVRPNIIATMRGAGSGPRVIVFSHVDIVPEGDLSKWTSDPFEPRLEDGKLYGRGSEDNNQAIVTSLFAVKALKDAQLTPPGDVVLAFVSDEELGSTYGLKYLLDKGVFRKEDLIVVPDFGVPEGDSIEVGEKSQLWLKLTTKGGQAHGSRPDLGNNAHLAAMQLGAELHRRLYKRFTDREETYIPPFSSFEPTKKEANVPNVNTIPGDDVFYMDCRILPVHRPDDVLELANAVVSEIAERTGCEITLEIAQREDAPQPTPADSPVVNRLSKAIRDVRGVEPKIVGIGGGTVAAVFRRAGYHAAVWGSQDECAHNPDEYARVDNMLWDTKVLAAMFMGE